MLGLFGLSVGNAHAAFATYTEEATFLNLLQPGYFQDNFDGVTLGSIQGASSTRTGGDFSVTYTASFDTLFSIPGGMSTASSDANLIATLSGSDIFAVGGYFFLTNFNGNVEPFPGESITATASNGIDADAPLTNLDNSATNFFGWISTTPITTVTVSGSSEFNSLDNFIVGAADAPAPAPEPGTLALLALGAAGLMRRRKQRLA